jgi:hypothetical protein
MSFPQPLALANERFSGYATQFGICDPVLLATPWVGWVPRITFAEELQENGRSFDGSGLFGKGICQRSFNWQSTAFVMRMLWVRVPPLAFCFRTRDRLLTAAGLHGHRLFTVVTQERSACRKTRNLT